MKLMIDLDGCVYNYVDAFADCVAEYRAMIGDYTVQAERKRLTPPESWTFYKQPGWDMTTPQFLEAMRVAIRYQDLFFRRKGKSYDDAVLSLHRLNMKHELTVVSARKYGRLTEAPAWWQTLRYLQSFQLASPQIEIILTESGESKAEVCVEHGITHAIEDSPDNWKDLHDAGIKTYLMDRPWNRGVLDVPSGQRVHSWGEFVEAMS